MYYPLAAGDRLYRITSHGQHWPSPMLGLGAYFNKGGRYNRVAQATVYCSEDPLVVISEMAFYQSLDWHHAISVHRFNPVTYPFVSQHRLWCFSIDPAPRVIDLEHPNAVHQFQYPPHLLLNPSLNPRHGPQLSDQLVNRDYVGTQELADEIRAYTPAGSPNHRPEGLKAPSVRHKKRNNYQPHQLALFVFDPNLHAQVPYENRATLIGQWDLRLEFLQVAPRQQVGYHTVDIDWNKARFRLSGAGAQIIPAYAARRGSREYRPNRWYNVEIQYA